MNKKILILFVLFIFIPASSVQAQTSCVLQDDSSITFSITISSGVGVHSVLLEYTFDTGIATAIYTLASSDAGTNGTLTIDESRYSDPLDSSAGYYVQLTAAGLLIRKNPASGASAGVFLATDTLTWNLAISGIATTPHYNVTAISATAKDVSNAAIAGGASVTTNPCNQAPTAPSSISISYSVSTPRRVTLTAVGATDSDAGDTLHYAWTVPGGTISGLSSGDIIVVDYATPGSPDEFAASAKAIDQNGAESNVKASPAIHPNDRPTIGGITPTNDTAVPLRVNLSSATSDADGETLSYAWTLSDGRTSAASSPSFDFATDGSYSASLIVTDARNLASTSYGPVAFSPNGIPSAAIRDSSGLTQKGNAWYGQVPYTADLVMTNYIDDTSGAAASLSWDMNNDGVYEITGASPSLHQSILMDTTGTKTIGMIAIAPDGFQSLPAKIILYAYPNEQASFSRATGLPYDSQKAPYPNDGILSGADSQAEPTGSPHAGVIFGENGWRGSYSIPFGDGTYPHMRIDLIREASNLFLGFDVDFDDELTTNDVIIIGLGKNESARYDDSVDQAALIKLNMKDKTIMLSTRGSGAWSAFTALSYTSLGIILGVNDQTASTGRRWSAELKLPVGSSGGPAWLNLDPRFLFFVDVYRSESTTASYVRFTWPRTNPDIQAIDDLASPQLKPVWWGLACYNDSISSNGIYFKDYSSIGVRNPANASGPLLSAFRYKALDPAAPNSNTVVNTLVARVYNDARKYLGDSGDPHMLPASDVRVRFKLANWGISSGAGGYWTDIDVNPTASPLPNENPTAYGTADAGESATTPKFTEFTANWVLSDPQIRDYTADYTDADGFNESHQCMLVELETRDNTAASGTAADAINIITKSVCRNMNFDAENAGKTSFVHKAEIDGRGYEALLSGDAKGSSQRKILLRLFTKTWKATPGILKAQALAKAKLARASLAAGGAIPPKSKDAALDLPYQKELAGVISKSTGTISFTEYIVKAYLYTGLSTRLGGKKMDELAPIGSYGYVVRHEGPTEDWDTLIKGEMVKKIDASTYLIGAEKDGAVKVTDTARAIAPAKWHFTGLGSASFAVANKPGAYGAGAGGQFTAEYDFGPDDKNINRIIQLGIGYDYAPSLTGDDIQAASLWAALRGAHQENSWLKSYGTFGAGLLMRLTDAYPCWVLGLGLELTPWRQVHFRLGGDFLGGVPDTYFIARVNAGITVRLMDN